MKKIITAATLAITGMFCMNANAATASGTANAIVIVPISITKSTDLNFGTFASPGGGTITVNTAGGRLTSNTTGIIFPSASNTSNPPAAAVFKVDGNATNTFAISIPTPSFNLTSAAVGATPMGVVLTTVATSALSAGTVNVPVSGVLTVAAGQVAGTYQGSFSMVVEYN